MKEIIISDLHLLNKKDIVYSASEEQLYGLIDTISKDKIKNVYLNGDTFDIHCMNIGEKWIPFNCDQAGKKIELILDEWSKWFRDLLKVVKENAGNLYILLGNHESDIDCEKGLKRIEKNVKNVIGENLKIIRGNKQLIRKAGKVKIKIEHGHFYDKINCQPYGRIYLNELLMERKMKAKRCKPSVGAEITVQMLSKDIENKEIIATIKPMKSLLLLFDSLNKKQILELKDVMKFANIVTKAALTGKYTRRRGEGEKTEGEEIIEEISKYIRENEIYKKSRGGISENRKVRERLKMKLLLMLLKGYEKNDYRSKDIIYKNIKNNQKDTVLIAGHTHQPKYIYDEEKRFAYVNPGTWQGVMDIEEIKKCNKWETQILEKKAVKRDPHYTIIEEKPKKWLEISLWQYQNEKCIQEKAIPI